MKRALKKTFITFPGKLYLALTLTSGEGTGGAAAPGPPTALSASTGVCLGA